MSFTLLLLVLFVGLSYYSRYKKSLAAAREEFAQMDDQQEDDETIFSMFDDEEDPFDDEDSFPNETMDEKPAEETYFTYETVQPEPQPEPVRPVRCQAASAPVMVEDTITPSFDLRQAVIGQMILNNPYSDEIK